MGISLIEEFIKSDLKNHIESYGYVSEDLDDFLEDNGYSDQPVSHRGKLYTQNGAIRAVSPEFFIHSLNEYLFVSKQVETGLSLTELLYTA